MVISPPVERRAGTVGMLLCFSGARRHRWHAQHRSPSRDFCGAMRGAALVVAAVVGEPRYARGSERVSGRRASGADVVLPSHLRERRAGTCCMLLSSPGARRSRAPAHRGRVDRAHTDKKKRLPRRKLSSHFFGPARIDAKAPNFGQVVPLYRPDSP